MRRKEPMIRKKRNQNLLVTPHFVRIKRLVRVGLLVEAVACPGLAGDILRLGRIDIDNDPIVGRLAHRASPVGIINVHKKEVGEMTDLQLSRYDKEESFA